MFIDLRSDTVTKPSKAMLEAMFLAEVGDDVFGEDPSVLALEKKIAERFGMEAAIFMPSGTMSNQVAIKTHTNPMQEVIAEYNAHILQYENGGYAFLSGVCAAIVHSETNKLSGEDIIKFLKPEQDWLPTTGLVTIENTVNRAGGICYTQDEIVNIYSICNQIGIPLHIDGARIYNAMVKEGYDEKFIGKYCDSITVCFSKGLGAPVGSALLGTSSFIKRARKYRKAFGGGMRQSGYLAQACIYALDNNISRLHIDHHHAHRIAAALKDCKHIMQILPVETNIIIFSMRTPLLAKKFVELMENNKIRIIDMGGGLMRMVTHLDISPLQIQTITEVIASF
jgi:threonine aldolase